MRNRYVWLAFVLLLGLSCVWVVNASGLASRSSKTRTVNTEPKEYVDANDVKVIGFRPDGECRPFQPNDRPVSIYASYADCDHVILEYHKVVLTPSHNIEAEPKQ